MENFLLHKWPHLFCYYLQVLLLHFYFALFLSVPTFSISVASVIFVSKCCILTQTLSFLFLNHILTLFLSVIFAQSIRIRISVFTHYIEGCYLLLEVIGVLVIINLYNKLLIINLYKLVYINLYIRFIYKSYINLYNKLSLIK